MSSVMIWFQKRFLVQYLLLEIVFQSCVGMEISYSYNQKIKIKEEVLLVAEIGDDWRPPPSPLLCCCWNDCEGRFV